MKKMMLPACGFFCILAACRNEDVYLAEAPGTVKYNQEWKKLFGPVDPEQTWNMAETKGLDIDVPSDGRIAIRAAYEDRLRLLGEFEVKAGMNRQDVDVPAGCAEVMVTLTGGTGLPQTFPVSVMAGRTMTGSVSRTESRATDASVPDGSKTALYFKPNTLYGNVRNVAVPNAYLLSEAAVRHGVVDYPAALPQSLYNELLWGASGGNAVMREAGNNYDHLQQLGALNYVVLRTTGGPVTLTYVGGQTA
ncbi:hypothetical protein [uncultured Bacteroides sp.]|uniref:hypothetical protein n=1 Tax=uncultured Bacteroides sp. TaxID=162156 RepID=UPI002619189C|nr:hypothetical protein [uncultured Bacteroides sp.]